MAIVFKPSTSTVSQQPSDNTGSKYRILTIFESTIQLDELAIISDETADSKKHKIEDVAGTEFPLIKINDYLFNRKEITSMSIDVTNFLPKITLTVNLIDQVFLVREMPKDGDIISLAIRSKSDILKIIRNDYVITGVHVAVTSTDVKAPTIITFYGELFVPGLKSQANDFSFLGTSFEALQDFAKRYGLGFATNEENTDDKQVWLKANVAADIYANDIVNRAWKDPTSFYTCWIDLYYNLNFINVNKQLLSTEDEIDPAALINNIDKAWTFGEKNKPEETIPMLKLFSNYAKFKNTSFYISAWQPINRASEITFYVGTSMICELFEHNKNIYENPKTNENKNYWAVKEEPIYDEAKTLAYILLRGRASGKVPTDIAKTLPPDESNTYSAKAHNSFKDLYEKHPWLGTQYTVSNPDADHSQWDGNHHRQYQRAKGHNLINLKELDKLNIHIEVYGNNFNIIKGDKIPVLLFRTNTFENIMVSAETGPHSYLDFFYSGWYYVKGFTINWENNSRPSISSQFSQEFVLTRREWPTPILVEPIKSKI
jgi:hypothetical protein